MTTDVRKALGEKARIERDKATAKEEAARKALLEVSNLKLAPDSCAVPALPVDEAQTSAALLTTLQRY